MRHLTCLGLFLLLATGLAAHEGELHKAAKEAKAAVVESGKAVAAAGKAVAADVKEAVDKMKGTVPGDAVVQVDPQELVKQHLRKHLHNKVVHFPIALGLLGTAFLIAALRWPSALGTGRWMLFFAGLGALAAFLTGGLQEAEFDGTSLAKAVESHELQGKVVLGLIWASFLLSWFPSFKKWSWVVYAFTAVGILFVASLGGAIAHS